MRILIASLLLAMTAGAPAQEHNVRRPQGYVPDAATAVRIAVAVWTPIYGAERIARQRPYTATLADGRWTVEGSLPRGMLGGTAIAVIAQEDGRVLRISHGR